MDRIRLKILGLSYSMSQNGAYALILSDETELKRIPIVIGMSEAQSIATQLENIHPQRPLTHDLIKGITDIIGIQLKEVFIYRFDAGIFYSKLSFDYQKNMIELDSRTSDAIALALRYDCSIYTTSDIMERAGIIINQENHDITFSVPEKTQTDISTYSIAELNYLLQKAIEKEEYEKASEIKEILDKKKQH